MKRTLSLVASLIVAGGAQAAVITLGPAPTSFGDVGVSGAGPALTGSLSLFDTNLGTLTGASLVLYGSMDTIISGVATSVASAQFTAETAVRMGFDSSLTALDSLLDPLSTFVLTGGPTGEQSLAPSASGTYGPFTDSDTTTIDLSSILASLSAAGGGMVDLSCNARAGMRNEVVGGNVDLSQRTNASCGYEITYTFDAPPPASVPEPATLALVGLTLAGIAATRRRKSA